MIKYIPQDTLVTFSEVPNEISLAINISNCQHHCVNCHSPYLRTDIGEEFIYERINELLLRNLGVSCVCLMGEGNDQTALYGVIKYIKEHWPSLKICLYSGRETIPEDFFWELLDYLKIGPYKPEFGPLNNRNTNQRFYKKDNNSKNGLEVNGVNRPGWIDVTNLFWS